MGWRNGNHSQRSGKTVHCLSCPFSFGSNEMSPGHDATWFARSGFLPLAALSGSPHGFGLKARTSPSDSGKSFKVTKE